MTAAAETGQAGERAATEHLRRAGYDICALNWAAGPRRAGHRSAERRRSAFRGGQNPPDGSLTPPEAAATQRKFRALSRAAACYLRTTGWEGEVQFDLASAEAFPDGTVRVELIESCWNTTGNFAVPTNYAIFAGLKKNFLMLSRKRIGHRRQETENLNTVNTDVVL